MIKRKPLKYQLFPSYLVITLMSLLAVSWYALSFIRGFYLEHTRTDLRINARLLEKQVVQRLSPLDIKGMDRFCKNTAGNTVTRVTVILPDGRVVGDSEEIPANMDNHRNREEVLNALSGRIGMSIRHSDTLKKNMMYMAMPLYAGEELIGILRTSIAITAVDEHIGIIRLRIGAGALLVALLASVFSWYNSRRITMPLEQMREGSKRFAAGDLSHRLAAPNTLELYGLADSMNQMARQLQVRMEEITRQKNNIEAVLSSMQEGVIATDLNQQVISINRAASAMFAADTASVKGKSILELVRNHEFEQLISQALSSHETRSSDIRHHFNGERILSVKCTPLFNSNSRRMGGLLVINDVTQLRRLENIRRDFAANVSHEIKTPLTAIKGFVETLVTGSLDNEEETRRFLGIIEKHVNRLTTIIDDLMQLSRIDVNSKSTQIHFETGQIKNLLETAIDICRRDIEEKGITVELFCPEKLFGRIDADLLDQALVNLLDNAVKYSPENSCIKIEAIKEGDEIQIRFKDQGVGIAAKHIPRLFERFYRVDKARSRKIGGTGLGLAIVKHIARAHGGKVTVKSTPGRGSTFILHLPI